MSDTGSTPQVQMPEAVLVDDMGAAGLLGIGATYFRRLVAQGRIGPAGVRLGRRRLHRVDELRRWVKAGLPNRAEWVRLVATEGKNSPHDGRTGPVGVSAPDTRSGGQE